MCIIFVAYQQHPRYPLIIAANRDEFRQRATRTLHRWSTEPIIYAGKDLEAGGSWLGVNTQGKIAALTNIRQPSSDQQAQSRGKLVINYLLSSHDQDFVDELNGSHQQYNGFNMLFGSVEHLHFYSSSEQQLATLTPGFYGISNASLDTPWPKLISGKKAIVDAIENTNTIDTATLFSLLQDTTPAADHDLPDTGVGLAVERLLSSIFINTENYGTRSSTVVLFDNNQCIQLSELTYDAMGQPTEVTTESFTIHAD